MQLRPDSHRRKWDKDEFEKLARDRLRDEEEDDDTAVPSTSKGGAANKREHDDDDDEANFDNLVNIFFYTQTYSNHLNTRHLTTKQYGCPVFKW